MFFRPGIVLSKIQLAIRIIGTFATLRKFLCFFHAKLRIRQPEVKNAINLKWLKVETRNLELRWGTYESFLEQILGKIGQVIRVSKPNTKMPIGGLNRSSLKTNHRSAIKVSNLEAPGHALAAPKIKL